MSRRPPGRSAASLLALCWTAALCACSTTSEVEFTPEESADEWTRMRDHFAGWKSGTDGMPDQTIRSEFEREDAFRRSEFSAPNLDREAYKNHPYFRTREVDRQAWQNGGRARETGNAAHWQDQNSALTAESYRTGAARETGRTASSGGEADLGRGSLPDRRSTEQGREVPLEVLDSPVEKGGLTLREAAERVRNLEDPSEPMTVDEVRRLLSPGE